MRPSSASTAQTGALTFAAAPNYEAPSDVGADNVYDVIVRVSDGALTATQAVAVTVTDVNEFAVGAISDVDAAANFVPENSANGTIVGITVTSLLMQTARITPLLIR